MINLVVKQHGAGDQLPMNKGVSLVQHETWHPEWNVWYHWSTGRHYYMIKVIKQHGVAGNDGLASAYIS